MSLLNQFSSQTTTQNDRPDSDIAIRSATPTDYAYYLEICPDIGMDYPPRDEVVWSKRELPETSILTQGNQSVGYSWSQKYDDTY